MTGCAPISDSTIFSRPAAFLRRKERHLFMSEKGSALGCGGLRRMHPFGICVGGIDIRYQSVLIFCSMGWFGGMHDSTGRSSCATVKTQNRWFWLGDPMCVVFFHWFWSKGDVFSCYKGVRIAILVKDLSCWGSIWWVNGVQLDGCGDDFVFAVDGSPGQMMRFLYFGFSDKDVFCSTNEVYVYVLLQL